ncbi:MAG: DUF1573 domain-containing protein [Planctomycetota bacterium]|jgi:hypothetical protein
MTTRSTVNRALLLAAATGVAWCAGCDRPASEGASPTESVPTSSAGGLAASTTAAKQPTSPARSSTAAPGTAPAITFASKTHDFGRILETEIQTAWLEFTNTGGSTLIIEDIKTSCGCTVATPDRREYEPGESGHIEIEFDPAGPGENQRKYVKVIANTEPELTQVAITADVDPFVIIEPRMLELGVLPYRSEHSRTLSVTSTDPDFRIEAVRTSNPAVTARVVGTIEPAGDGTPRKDGVEVTIASNAPWGPLFSWLEMDVKGTPGAGADPITYEAKLRVQGQLFGDLRAEPDTLRFGAEPGQAFERTVVLRRADGAPFTVLGAEVLADRLDNAQVRVDQVGPGEYQVTLTATAGSIMAMVNGAVMVSTDVDGEGRVDIPIVGVIRKVAEIR